MDKWRIIQKKPLLALQGEHLHQLPYAFVTDITVGEGEIAVQEENFPFSSKKLLYGAMLATLGLTTEAIAHELRVSPATARRGLARVQDELNLLRNRNAIARGFFDREIYKVAKKGAPIGLVGREVGLIEELSMGHKLEEAGAGVGYARTTVAGDLAEITSSSGWHGQEKIVLASIVSGEIGNYASKVERRS